MRVGDQTHNLRYSTESSAAAEAAVLVDADMHSPAQRLLFMQLLRSHGRLRTGRIRLEPAQPFPAAKPLERRVRAARFPPSRDSRNGGLREPLDELFHITTTEAFADEPISQVVDLYRIATRGSAPQRRLAVQRCATSARRRCRPLPAPHRSCRTRAPRSYRTPWAQQPPGRPRAPGIARSARALLA